MASSELDLQLTDPATFATGRHHELFRRLRQEEPVHWTDGDAPRPFWSVTRHADCVTLLKDPETFSSRLGGLMPLSAQEPNERERQVGGYGSIPTHSDPPRHLTIRRPFNKHFSAPVVGRMDEAVRRCVDDILLDILPLGQCDLVEQVTAQLPARFVCEMMGVPKADHAMIQHYCAAFMGAEDPHYQIDGDALKTQRTMMMSLFNYMFELAMNRRSKPADDFTSVVANMEVDGELLSDRDVGWWCFSIVAAGLETTRDALAVGFLELFNHPDQAELLRTDPKLILTAADEFVRWANPSMQKFRVATRDVELGGKTIRAGDWVIAWLVSANRDEAVFDDPFRFDVTRSPNRHIGFGVGEHSCIGRHLARLEMQVMISELLRLMPDMELAGQGEWLQSTTHTSLKRLPVRFTPRPSLAA